MMDDCQALPQELYRAEQVRELDRLAIQEQGIPGIQLMRRAGRFTFDQLLLNWPDARAVSVWCGPGNNGGDGYIVAGLAVEHGLKVQLVQVGPEERLAGDAARACQWARECGVIFTPWSESVRIEADVVVDALLGTGLNQSVRSPFDRAISVINQSGVPVIAVDIPSGLCSDTGCVLGDAVHADVTASFIGLKQGMFTAQGPLQAGRLVFNDLAVPAVVYDGVQAQAKRLDPALLQVHFAPRSRDAHKGHFGHVLIVGGNLGMGGAAIMAAQAAGRVGAGLVSVATRPEHVSAFLARSPEIMVHGVDNPDCLCSLLENKSAVVVGPGLGQDEWARGLLQQVLASSLPLVVDADALNLLAASDRPNRGSWILTPHPGEAARLLGTNTASVQRDRFAAVRQLQQAYGGVALLKGLGSLVSGASGNLMLCTTGNPGMASGGMGDVLSGVLGSLLAQGMELESAAGLGVMLHAMAADQAAEQGERGLLATDLLPRLRALVNPCQHLS
jgi:NAD(P)H-hydrate epimerase